MALAKLYEHTTGGHQVMRFVSSVCAPDDRRPQLTLWTSMHAMAGYDGL